MPLPELGNRKGIVLYTSYTGYTKRYAEHIAKELGYDIKPIRKAHLFNVSLYPTIIYGGGLHHNKIDGIRGMQEGGEYFADQRLILFSVGLASVNEELIKQIRDKNFPEELMGPYYYFDLPGGLSYANTQPGGLMYDKVVEYRKRRDEGKKMTRGDKIALDIADGVSPEQDRFNLAACDPIIEIAGQRVR